MSYDTAIHLDDLKLFPLEELKKHPTEAVGQDADLKYEDWQTAADGRILLVRFWLNRGDRHDHTRQVEVEARNCPHGSWQQVAGLYPFPPRRNGWIQADGWLSREELRDHFKFGESK